MRDSPYAGNILYIDLSTGKTFTEPTMDYAGTFLGGRGINQWLLYRLAKPEKKPLDPENPLIFGAGVLSGTAAPGATRISVVAKNYVTGGVGFANSSGRFGAALKRAGFDHVVVTGQAPHPVYLAILDGKAELRDARSIWGCTTWEAEDFVESDLGSGRVEIGGIGPAGENLTKMGCIIFNRGRAAARCGLGSVMGSKNLKAVAVGGSAEIGVANPERFMGVVKRSLEKIEAAPSTQHLRAEGTLCFVKPSNESGIISFRNWQDDRQDPKKVDSIVDPLLARYETRKLTCVGCPIRCSHYFEVKDGPYAGTACEGIQANLMQDFGTNLDIDYAPFLLRAQALCSQLGLDADNTAGTIGWAFECFQLGLLTEADTAGLKLRWGDHQTVDLLMQMIARREGFGALLAKGSRDAAVELGRGSDKYAIHLKGQDQWEPMRALRGWSLGTAVATRGGGHLDGAPVVEFGGWTPEACQELFGVATAGDPTVAKGKAKVVSFYEKFKGLVDCLGICYFTTQWECPEALSAQDLADLYNAATGEDRSSEDLMVVGDRVHNIGKAFNTLHAGFTRQDDWPADRFFDEPVKSGPATGAVLNRTEWNEMLDEYYEEKGWDKSTGLQTRRTLEALGISEVADRLETAGKMP